MHTSLSSRWHTVHGMQRVLACACMRALVSPCGCPCPCSAPCHLACRATDHCGGVLRPLVHVPGDPADHGVVPLHCGHAEVRRAVCAALRALRARVVAAAVPVWVCCPGAVCVASPGAIWGVARDVTPPPPAPPLRCSCPARSRRCKELIGAAFDRSVDGGRASPLLNSRLHDFGFRYAGPGNHRKARIHSRVPEAEACVLAVGSRPARPPMRAPPAAACRGCTCVEQSVLGGVAHLLSFDGTGGGGVFCLLCAGALGLRCTPVPAGRLVTAPSHLPGARPPLCTTDTLSAAYYAQFALNGGRPVGQSIPATEHSVMTSWSSGGQRRRSGRARGGDRARQAWLSAPARRCMPPWVSYPPRPLHPTRAPTHAQSAPRCPT